VELYRQLAAGVLDRLLFHVEDLVAVNLLLLVLHALGLVRHRHELLLAALCRFLPAVGIVRSPIPTAGRIQDSNITYIFLIFMGAGWATKTLLQHCLFGCACTARGRS
jgi:hypothetical protein